MSRNKETMFTKSRKGTLMLMGVFFVSALTPWIVSQLLFPIGEETTASTNTPLIGAMLISGTLLLVIGIFLSIWIWYMTKSLSKANEIHFGKAGAIRWACIGLIWGTSQTISEYANIWFGKILGYLIVIGGYYVAFKVFRPVERK